MKAVYKISVIHDYLIISACNWKRFNWQFVLRIFRQNDKKCALTSLNNDILHLTNNNEQSNKRMLCNMLKFFLASDNNVK